ncbi:MAG: SGNH/GDSL hydrolase family protein, partial [Myxococcota bacterium]
MRALALDAAPVEIVGALELRRSPTGISPRRLPAWTAPQIPDAFMDLVVQMTSGVRIAFRTTSTSLELDVLATGLQLEGDKRAPTVFDLVVNGEPVGSHATDAGNTLVIDVSRAPFGVRFEAGAPCSLRFDSLPAAMKDVELWLPQAATVELRGLRVDDGAHVEARSSARPRWVHYGSSISHCMEAASPLGIWPAVAARRARVDLLSLGLAGQGHLDGFVARTIAALDADLISAKVGINVVNADSLKERTFVPALHAFLDTIRERKPATPILLVSPIFCPSAEDHIGPTVRVGTAFGVLEGAPELRPGSLTLRRIRE